MKHKFHWLSEKIESKSTDAYGTGLFAIKNIKQGERLIVIGGYIMSIDEESTLSGKCSDNGVQITEDLVISISKPSEYEGYNFLNHNCEPNSGFKGQIFLVAMRDIKKGEEITIDYAMVLYKTKNGPRYKLACLCGQKNCRGFITDMDWQKRDLQTKYDGYFQYFIQEKIDAQKGAQKT